MQGSNFLRSDWGRSLLEAKGIKEFPLTIGMLPA
jgi:hypothetical protein